MIKHNNQFPHNKKIIKYSGSEPVLVDLPQEIVPSQTADSNEEMISNNIYSDTTASNLVLTQTLNHINNISSSQNTADINETYNNNNIHIPNQYINTDAGNYKYSIAVSTSKRGRPKITGIAAPAPSVSNKRVNNSKSSKNSQTKKAKIS